MHWLEKRGFTLIELLTVIAIIGILASIILVSLAGAEAKGRDAKRISDVRTLQLALETYYNDHSAYPVTLSPLAPTYLPTIPCDPKSTGTFPSCTIPYKYSAYDVTGSANCSSNPLVVVKYHMGTVLEDTTNTGLSQDADFVAGSTYTLCSGSGADFVGTALNCVGTTGVGLGVAENCYDVTN